MSAETDTSFCSDGRALLFRTAGWGRRVVLDMAGRRAVAGRRRGRRPDQRRGGGAAAGPG